MVDLPLAWGVCFPLMGEQALNVLLKQEYFWGNSMAGRFVYE